VLVRLTPRDKRARIETMRIDGWVRMGLGGGVFVWILSDYWTFEHVFGAVMGGVVAGGLFVYGLTLLIRAHELKEELAEDTEPREPIS
jgi:hypothetical protein